MSPSVAAPEVVTRALREVDAANRRFLAMCDLAIATGGELDRQATLQAVAREAARLLRVEAAYVATPTGSTIVSAGHPRPLADPRSLAMGAPTDSQPRIVPAEHLGVPGDTALVAPLIDAGGTIGALAFVDRVGAAFDATDLWVASAIAAQTVAALRTIRLHERALETARIEAEYAVAGEVQRQLLPNELVRVPGLDVAVRSRAALQVGGDFLDHRLTPTGDLHLAIGDVSGKGMSAAMLAAVTHLALQRWSQDLPGGSPAGILAAANHETYEPLDDVGMLVTAFVASVNAATGGVTYANAGQAPVLHVTADRRTLLLPATTVPLGVLPVPTSREEHLQLEEGELLIIGTDGLIEQRDPSGELFGLTRLQAVVEHFPLDLTAAEAADALVRAVAAWADGVPADDDLSVIVLRPEANR